MIFNWLFSKKFDIICLQETHFTKSDIDNCGHDRKTVEGGEPVWNCETSDSRGVGFLIQTTFEKKYLLLITMKVEDVKCVT